MTFILISAILIIAFGILPSLTFVLDWLALAGLSKLLLVFCISYVLMLLINLIVPSVWPGFKAGCLGALISAVGMTVVMVFINLFRNAATYDTIYGPLASIAAILILLNWMSHIIYFGICFSSVIYLEKNVKEGGCL